MSNTTEEAVPVSEEPAIVDEQQVEETAVEQVRTVPLEALEAERRKRQDVEAQHRALQDFMLKSKQPEKAVEDDEDEEDFITKADFKKMINKVATGSIVDNALAATDAANAILGAVKNAYGDTMSFWYQMEDVVFKVAKIADELDRGTPPALAALEARKYFFDYSAVPPIIRKLSNSGIAPFIRYTYFAVPNFLEQVGTSPWRLLYTGYGQYLGLMFLASMMWGLWDDEDSLWDNVITSPNGAKETMSEYLAKRPMLMPVPWRDEHGRQQWIDLGYLMPEGALLSAVEEGSGGDPIAVMNALGVNGGPMGNVYAGLRTGVDPFRQMPIYEETDDDGTRFWKRTWFTMRNFAPSLYGYYLPPLTGETQGSPGYEALFGTGLDRQGQPTQTGSQLLGRALGLNVYPNDAVYGQGKRYDQFQWQIDEIDRNISRAYASMALTEEGRDQYVAQQRRRLDEILADRDEYITRTSEAVEAESRRQQERN